MKTRSLIRILAAMLAVAGCGGGDVSDGGVSDGGTTPDASNGSDAAPPADGGTTEDDAGHDGGTTDAGSPATELRVERWGDRLYGAALGMTRIGRELWIGTTGAIDPSVGIDAPIRAQLARLDLDTGALRIFEDELPRVRDDLGREGPTPTAGVVADGARRFVASLAGLLVVEGDTVTLHPLMVDGSSASPTHLVLDRDGGRARLVASTDRGVLDVDPDTLTVRSSISNATLGGSSGAIAVDPSTGAVFVAVHPADDPSGHLARVLGDDIATLTPGEDGVPSGLVNDLVWSSTYGGVLASLASWSATEGGVIFWDGTESRSIVDEGALSTAARGEAGAFGAWTLAYDESEGVLIVGGRIRSSGPIGILSGGGLAWVDVSDPSAPAQLFGVSAATSDIRGDIVNAAAYDPVDRRTYVSLRQPCDELRMGNAGIHSIFFEDGKPRFELPILSSVRDIQRVDGELWIGVRDDNEGSACEGVEIQVGLARVDGSHGAEVPFVRGWPATRANVTALDFRGLDRRVVAGWRTEIFAGSATDGVLISPAIDVGVSLWPEDVLWEDDRTFWVAGHSSHSAGDPENVADVGPRGAARVVLNEAGAVESSTLYVRRARDPMPGVIQGLPSAEVYDVLLDASGAVYLVCGIERLIGTYDRVPRDPFMQDGQQRRGGIVRIEDDGSITVVAGPSIIPDGRAGAFAPDGTLYVLDAMRGLLRQTDDGGFEVVELPEVPAGSEPQALWIGEDGDLVAAFDTGALVRVGDQSRFIDDVGFVWSVEASSDVLILGTDRGLVRVIPEGVIDTGEPAPVAGEAPPFIAIEPPPPTGDGGVGDGGVGDGGVCLMEGQPCGPTHSACCPGLACASHGIILTCTATL